jgi:hypothetical protein
MFKFFLSAVSFITISLFATTVNAMQLNATLGQDIINNKDRPICIKLIGYTGSSFTFSRSSCTDAPQFFSSIVEDINQALAKNPSVNSADVDIEINHVHDAPYKSTTHFTFKNIMNVNISETKIELQGE